MIQISSDSLALQWNERTYPSLIRLLSGQHDNIYFAGFQRGGCPPGFRYQVLAPRRRLHALCQRGQYWGNGIASLMIPSRMEARRPMGTIDPARTRRARWRPGFW